jgi:hypothetical protein
MYRVAATVGHGAELEKREAFLTMANAKLSKQHWLTFPHSYNAR